MYKNKHVRNYSSKKSPKKWLLIAGIVLVLIVIGAYWLYAKNSSRPPALSANSNTKGESDASPSPSNTDQNANQTTPSTSTQPTAGDSKQNQSSAPTSSTSASLLKPTGAFVSNHHSRLSSGYNTQQSVCTTTPGATCAITFMKDGVTKSLQAQQTDKGGSAYWSWKLQDIGLTAGDWAVQATATLNGQTQSASDALKLEVQP